jgi:hypothetical protein
LAGVTVDIDDTDEDLGGIDDVEVDEFPVEDIGVEEEEEEVSLEEMINSILEEDDDEDLLEEEEEELEEVDGAMTGDKKKTSGRKRGSKRGDEAYKNEGRIQVVDDEYLMKEVSRRVKTRLANLVKEQRRRKRPIKRKK